MVPLKHAFARRSDAHYRSAWLRSNFGQGASEGHSTEAFV